MGLFGGVGGSRFSGRDPFFNENVEFLVEIAGVDCFPSQNPKHKGSVMFKIRARVLGVAFDDKDYGLDNWRSLVKGKEDEKVLRPGQYGTQLINLAHAPAMGDIKNFATVMYRQFALGADPPQDPDKVVDPNTFGDVEIEALYDASQPCAGQIVGLRTMSKKTQGGGDFTQHEWVEAAKFKFSLPVRATLPEQPARPATENEDKIPF